MTKDEAMNEMSYCGVNQEHILSILDNCTQKNISPQYLDCELEKLGYSKFFSLEYEEYGVAEDSFTTSKNKKHALDD